MSNKKRSAVEWLSNQAYELFEQYSEGKFDRIQLNKLMLKATEQAKEMEKQQIIDAYVEGCSDSILDESTDKTRSEDYYNKTYKQD